MTHPVGRVWRRVLNAIAPGYITAADDSGAVGRVQCRIGYMEVIDGLKLVQDFGLSSVPPAGSDAVVVFVGGDRSNGVAIATSNQTSRPKARASGETTVYNAFGMSIYLSQTGIVINAGGLPVTLNGDLRVTGEVTRGYGGSDAVTLGAHRHIAGAVNSPTQAPTAGT